MVETHPNGHIGYVCDDCETSENSPRSVTLSAKIEFGKPTQTETCVIYIFCHAIEVQKGMKNE